MQTLSQQPSTSRYAYTVPQPRSASRRSPGLYGALAVVTALGLYIAGGHLWEQFQSRLDAEAVTQVLTCHAIPSGITIDMARALAGEEAKILLQDMKRRIPNSQDARRSFVEMMCYRRR